MTEDIRRIISDNNLDIKSLLTNLKELVLNANNIRFRPVGMTRKDTVHVDDWCEPSQRVKPELYRRLFYDPNKPECCAGIIGLVARINIIVLKEETVSNEDQDLINLKKILTKYTESKILYENIKNNSTDAYLFNNIQDPEFYLKRYYDDFIMGIKKSTKTKKEKYNGWKVFKSTIIGFANNDADFFNKCSKIAPWTKEVENKRQWEELWELLEKSYKDDINKQIKEFKDKVEKTETYYHEIYKDWNYFLQKLHDLQHVIAIPVVISGELFGVLTVDSSDKTKPFTKEDNDLCLDYANMLGVAYLHQKHKQLQRLQRLAEEMVTAESFGKIGAEITGGIRIAIHGIEGKDLYPLLYVCKKPILSDNVLNDFSSNWNKVPRDEPSDDDNDDIIMWEEEKRLYNTPIRDKGLGSHATEMWKISKKEEVFVVADDVDNPDSDKGSRNALMHNVKTSGCLPLANNNSIYGLLYIHCKKHHSFTWTELEALKIFGNHAAIAISNSKRYGHTYYDYFGASPLDRLTENTDVTEGENSGVRAYLYELKNKISRLNIISKVEITNEINRYFDDLCSILNIPKNLIKRQKKFLEEEKSLSGIRESYREHYIHQFHVFLAGYICAEKLGLDYLCNLLNKKYDPSQIKWTEDDIVKAIFLQSMWHDCAYLSEFLEEVLKYYITEFYLDWNSFWKRSHSFVSRLAKLLTKEDEKKVKIEELFINEITKRQNHGVIASVQFMEEYLEYTLHAPEDKKMNIIYLESALSIALHNWPVWKPLSDVLGDKITFYKHPLQYLLMYNDFVQEWGREVHREVIYSNEEPKLVYIDSPDSGHGVVTKVLNKEINHELLGKQINSVKKS